MAESDRDVNDPAGSSGAPGLRSPMPWWLSRGAGCLLLALLVAVIWTSVWSSAARSVTPVASLPGPPAAVDAGVPVADRAFSSTRSEGVGGLTARDLRSSRASRLAEADADENSPKAVDVPNASDRAAMLLRREQRRDRQLAAFIRSAPAVLASWVAPLGVPYRITATFGAAGSLWSADHTGVDLAAPTGTPVATVSAGTVTSAGDSGAYGLRVAITHPDGTQSMYAHLSGIDVSVGEEVATGDEIGAVGTTGNSTGPHLHLELRSSAGVPIDPVRALGARGVHL